MGDMADYYLDSVFVDDDDHFFEVAGIACRYCKRGPFWWQDDDNGKWRLVTASGKLHNCKQYKFGSN